MPHLRLLTLGPPRVVHRGVELTDLPTQRLRCALLVYLATEGEVAREAALSMFWPDRDPARARHALRQMLYELRQPLGDDWLKVRRDRIRVIADVDARDFEQAVARQDVEGALSLYNGDFLQGFTLDNHAFDGWVDRHRVQLARRHRRVCRDYVAARVAAGELNVALRSAQRWVELDPLEDEANHALIHCLALTGQRVAALQTYEAYERRLAQELDVQPLDETRALVERIRAGDDVEGPKLTVGPALPAGPAPAGAAAETAVAAGPVATDPVSVAPAERQGGSIRRWPWLQSAAAVALLLTVMGAAAVLTRNGGSPADLASMPKATRILVLPFTDHNEDGTLVPLAGALTEELARSLAQSQGLDVVSPNGVSVLLESGVSADSVRRELAADYVVTGSLLQRNGRVRMTIELMDGRTGSMVRNHRVERPADESYALVDDAIDQAAGILRREVSKSVDIRRARSQTDSENAWRLYVEGRSQREGLSRLIAYHDYNAANRTLERADSLLGRAAELDRRWAEPVILRGWIMESREMLLTYATPADTAARRKALEAARSLAERGLDRDRSSANAYELRATVLQRLARLPTAPADSIPRWVATAEQDLLRAAQLDPQSANVWIQLAELHYMDGQYAAAKNAAERAWGIDRYIAQAPIALTALFRASLELGDDAEARRWCDEGRQRYPDDPPFTWCLFMLHAWADGVRPDPGLLRRELQALHADPGKAVQRSMAPTLNLLLAAAHARAGEQDSARAILSRIPPDAVGAKWLHAAAFATLNDYSTALALLGEYLREDASDAARVVASRPFWKFRGRPEYDQLLRLR
jgi:DNA-binding SARP family transcriptional activator/TolB-like protein